MEDFIGVIFDSIDKRILSLILINGFILFYIYFYKSSIWHELSDFDKLFFSVLCGFFVYFGLIFPIVQILFQLLLFRAFETIISSDEIMLIYKLFSTYFILAIFILRLLFPYKAPYDNIKIFKPIFITFLFSTIFVILLCAEFCFIIFLSPFNEYTNQLLNKLLVSVVPLCIFLYVYFSIHSRYLIISVKLIFKYIYSVFKSYNLCILPSILFLLLLSFVASSILLDSKVIENGDNLKLISIKEIDLTRSKVDSARELILRDYTIKMPVLTSWVKVKPNLILKNNSDNESNFTYIVLENENAFVINKTSKIVNVTVSLYNSTEVCYSKMVMFKEPSFTNDSVVVNISLNNYLLYPIEIETLSVPIHEGYKLEENSFEQAQHFANISGDTVGCLTKGDTVYLRDIHLEKNSSGTIMLKLVKTSL